MGWLRRLFGTGKAKITLGTAPDPTWSAPPADLRVGDRPPPPGQPVGSVGHVFTSSQVFVNGQPVSGDQLGEAERLSGFDLDGDGRIAGGAAAGKDLQSIIDGAFAAMPAMPGAADQRVGLLERLAALRDSGAITPAEFEAEKAKILGG